jgi:hypothetical protein
MLANQKRVIGSLAAGALYTVPRGHRVVIDCLRFYVEANVGEFLYLQLNGVIDLYLGLNTNGGEIQGVLTFPNKSFIITEGETLKLFCSIGIPYGLIFGILEKVSAD